MPCFADASRTGRSFSFFRSKECSLKIYVGEVRRWKGHRYQTLIKCLKCGRLDQTISNIQLTFVARWDRRDERTRPKTKKNRNIGRKMIFTSRPTRSWDSSALRQFPRRFVSLFVFRRRSLWKCIFITVLLRP